jgi:hypothetical protein
MRGSRQFDSPHDLVDDELRVPVDIEPLDPKIGSDTQTIDEGLIFDHIVVGSRKIVNLS